MEGIQHAGEFHILGCEIQTSNGLWVNLKQSLLSITLFEDLGTSHISGQVILQDSFALPSIGPLIGQEYLSLKLATPSLEDSEHTIDFTENVFHVYNIGKRESMGEGIQAIVLNIISSEHMKNNRTFSKKYVSFSNDFTQENNN